MKRCELMLKKVNVREAVEDVLDRFDVDMKESRRRSLVSALEGALELLVSQERDAVLRIVRPYPAAKNALLKRWRMDK
jgi:hypothetical protein